MYVGYEAEIEKLESAILNKEKNCWICGVEVKLSSYHTNLQATATNSAIEIIRLLHTPAIKVIKKVRTKRKSIGKKVNGIKYLI